MDTVRRLMNQTNPVRETRTTELSERARDELEALVGASHGAGRKPRRRLLVAALATAAAVLVVGVVGVVAFRALSPQPPSADEPFYENTAALERSADTIVRATILSTREQDKNGFPETVAKVLVAKVAKGNIAVGGTAEVAYATPGSGPETPTGLAVGGEYVLLLVRSADAPASLVNTTQGYYTISDNRAAGQQGNAVELSPEVKRGLGIR